MIETVLGIIKDKLNEKDVPYEFMRWTTNTVPNRYWIGEYSESPTYNEDGSEEYVILLTGTTNDSWLELLGDVAKIKDLFPSIGGFRKKTDKGAVVIFYDNCFPVPTGEANIKRNQINLTIKVWKGIK